MLAARLVIKYAEKATDLYLNDLRNVPNPIANACEVLAELFISTQGRHWASFQGTYLSLNDLYESKCCEQKGIVCSNRDTDMGSLVQVKLPNRNLTGKLPSQFWERLTELRYVDLSGNPLLEIEPANEVSKSLYFADLSGASLSSFPTWILSHARSRRRLSLILAHTKLNGVLPQLNLEQVDVLDVHGNPDLTGYLFSEAIESVALDSRDTKICLDPFPTLRAPFYFNGTDVDKQFPFSVGSSFETCSWKRVVMQYVPLLLGLVVAVMAYLALAIKHRNPVTSSPLALLSFISIVIEGTFVSFLISSMKKATANGTGIDVLNPNSPQSTIYSIVKLIGLVSLCGPRICNAYYTRISGTSWSIRFLTILDIWHFVFHFRQRGTKKSPYRNYIPPHLRLLTGVQAILKEGTQFALATWYAVSHPGTTLPNSGWKLPVMLMFSASLLGIFKELVLRYTRITQAQSTMVGMEWPGPSHVNPWLERAQAHTQEESDPPEYELDQVNSAAEPAPTTPAVEVPRQAQLEPRQTTAAMV
jgi:hypothetical protein